MAPLRPQLSGSQKITSFFSSSALPRVRRPDPDGIPVGDEEVVVASSDAGSRRSAQQSSPSPPILQTNSGATKKRELRAGTPVSTAPLSSSVCDSGNTPPRLRGKTPENSSRLAAQRVSPVQSPPRYNINPIDGAADVTPTKDSPYREPAQSSSRPRLVAGMPTSRPVSHTALTPSLPTRAGCVPNPIASHASDSRTTTTTMPAKSCSSFSTSIRSSADSVTALRSSTNSRRIVKDGLKAIANSDSDMTDDSSGEELADLSSFFVKRRKLSHEPVKAVPAPKSTRSSGGVRQNELLQSMIKSPQKRVYKYSLASLSREDQKMKESQVKIASMQQAVEESKRREEEAARQEALGPNIDTDKTVSLEWASDDEEGDRKLKALQRVEALHATDNYYFFLDDEPLFQDSPFPVNSLPNEPWSKLYATDTSREQACVSGLAAEMVLHFPLPMAVTNWMAQQLLHERNDALCEAYVGILEASSSHNESLSDTIASLSSMYKTRSLFENNWKAPVRRGLPAGLKYVLRVVQSRAPAVDDVAPDAAPIKTIEAFLDLAMMNLDDLVRKNLNLSSTLMKCIEDLLDSLSETSFEKLVPGVLAVLDDSERELPIQLHCRLIASLPARTTRSYHLRRRLALDVLLPKDERRKAESSERNWLETILKALESGQQFNIGDATDYALLMALINVADIAVSAGFTGYDALHPSQASSEKSSLSIYAGPPPVSQAAKIHNRQIDAIVSEMEYMKSRIQHESTSLCRQELKAALERVTARLGTSVRTRPKPKKQIFGTERKQAHFATNMLKIAPNALDGSGAEETESMG